ncbi:MAG: TatD family hydrolase [Clostridiales bacterium]|nr:TatD family hydrolase [Clostridiales bacterium]
MNLLDSHCHLNDDLFEDDWQEALLRMQQAGVARCILAGSDMASSTRIVEMTSRNEPIYGVVGIHPHEAKTYVDGDIERLKEWIKLDKIVGLGEIGLDYFYDFSPREVQKEVFMKQLLLARELGVPAAFHVRDAHGDLTDIFRAHKNELPAGVLHCFSGSVESAREYLDMGFYLSFAGPVTFKNAAKLQLVATYCPIDRILVETDSPYLSPVPLRGKRNEPANVVHVAAKIAELRGMDVEEFGQITTANTCRLFGITP